MSCTYASSFFSHPHWPYIAACCLHSTPSSSNVTAGGSQYVICAKYEIRKTFNQQLQPRGYSSGTTHAICWTLSSPSFPAQYLPLALTRSPKGLPMHKLLLTFQISLMWNWGWDILCMISLLTIQGLPLGYPPPIIPTLLEVLNKRSLGPSLPPTN